MITFFRILTLLCIPAIVCNSPLMGSSLKEEVKEQNQTQVQDSPSYNPLSLTMLFDLIEKIEDGDLEQVEDLKTVYDVMDLIILLAQNGIPDFDLLSKEELEDDIEELFIDEDEENYLGISYLENFSEKFSIIPAVFHSDQYDHLTCGWLSKKWKKIKKGTKKGAKKTKKFVKKHKKKIIIGAVIVAVVVGVGIAVAATSGAAAATAGVGSAAAAGGSAGIGEAAGAAAMALGGGTAAIAATREEKQTPHINKAGNVRFQEDVAHEQDLLTYNDHNESAQRGLPFNDPQLDFAPTFSSLREMKEEIDSLKSDCSEITSDGTTGWSEYKKIAKEKSSSLAHKIFDDVAREVIQPLADDRERIGNAVKKASEAIESGSLTEAIKGCFDSLTELFVSSSSLEGEDGKKLIAAGHQKIDEVFGTDQSDYYGPDAYRIEDDCAIGILPFFPEAPAVFGKGGKRLSGPITSSNTTKGWKAGDPINNLTTKGDVPRWSTVRDRHWKNQAKRIREGAVDTTSLVYEITEENLFRMEKGLAPKKLNPKTGKAESIELHHEPPQRNNGKFDFIEVTPQEHARIDPQRHIGDN